jgi:hypothetical protein
MYYWQPQDLEKLEKDGLERTEFDLDEVNYARHKDL